MNALVFSLAALLAGSAAAVGQAAAPGPAAALGQATARGRATAPAQATALGPAAAPAQATAPAGGIGHARLQARLDALVPTLDGRLGVCVRDAAGESALLGDARFSLQSVMKLLVGLAVMDRVDRQGWRLADPVLVRRADLSLFVQPLEKLVTARGYATTMGDLVRRAIVDSDSAATDILIGRLGGAGGVQMCLTRLGLDGLRIDRDERHLQTEILGLEWRPEYVDPKLLEQAIEAVPRGRRAAAWRAYQGDLRDTSTPRAMARLLDRLAAGKLLSESSTAHLLNVLGQTVTFPDRLKAGLAPGWTIGHKTGTSGSWDGVTAATNDVGVLHAPDGGAVAVAVFVADSRASMAERAAVMAKVSAAAVEAYRASPRRTAYRIRSAVP